MDYDAVTTTTNDTPPAPVEQAKAVWLSINGVVERTTMSRPTVERAIYAYRNSGGAEGLKHYRPGGRRVLIAPSDADRWAKELPPLPDDQQASGQPQRAEQRRNGRGAGVPARQRTRKPTH